MREATGRLLSPLLLVPAAVFAADRFAKLWAMERLAPAGSIRLLPFLRLTYVENTGAAFGSFQGGNAALAAVSIALLAALARLWARRPREDLLSRWGCALVAGGALGNLYDRLLYGRVVDFLDLVVWPVFNAADACISVGAVLLAWGLSRKSG